MKTTRTVLLVLITAGSVFSACKKDKNNNNGKKPDCRLKSVTLDRTGGGSSWDFKYGSDGKVISITLTNGAGVTVKDFTYTGNTILAISTNNGAIAKRDSITVDAKGRATNIRNYGTSGSWENYAYEYNGDELSQLIQTSSLSVPKTSAATYSNGNLVSLVSPYNTVTYEYFPEETQVADYLTLRSFTDYGFATYPHKSLMKSLSSGGSTTTVTYEKNADGLINKSTAIAAGTELKYSFEYECN